MDKLSENEYLFELVRKYGVTGAAELLPTIEKIKFCYWKYCDDDYNSMLLSYWETECDNKFVFNDGTPQDNGFAFCPYCGKQLV